MSMDVTFREEEPYYTKKGDLDPFLEEFSSVIESDSREGENENDDDVQNNGVTHKKVVVGTIPYPINEHGGSGDLASEASGGVIGGGVENDEASGGVSAHHDDSGIASGVENDEDLGGASGDHDDPSIGGQEGMEDGEAVVVGTIPCPTVEKVNEKQGEQPIVYFRRRTKKQGVQPQPEQAKAPVPYLSSDSSPLNLPPSAGNVSPTFEPVELPIAQSRDRRVNAEKPPSRYGYEHDIAKYVSYSSVSPTYRTFIASLQAVPIPKDWRCAEQDPKWKDAIKEELLALQKNKTWELIHLAEGKKAVGCKWVFTVKQTPEGEVDRYKARLVAKGYSQTYGIDYDETFTPMAKNGHNEDPDLMCSQLWVATSSAGCEECISPW